MSTDDLAREGSNATESAKEQVRLRTYRAQWSGCHGVAPLTKLPFTALANECLKRTRKVYNAVLNRTRVKISNSNAWHFRRTQRVALANYLHSVITISKNNLNWTSFCWLELPFRRRRPGRGALPFFIPGAGRRRHLIRSIFLPLIPLRAHVVAEGAARFFNANEHSLTPSALLLSIKPELFAGC
ncbi:unnamed protein product [Toxocara canis]|uniref:Uncharacterized protein n=1 Tax=Toxocara canis TaxID=6265 RepID=A0A183V2B6_TOXCA|nr:unnamed protein product [Toxocara canis]